MAFGQSRVATATADDRRRITRMVVDCEAAFETHSGIRLGRLKDLSSLGARFDAENPLTVGTSGLLRWHDQEHFAQIVWTEGRTCGFQFERPVPEAAVERTADVVEVELGPVAQFGNIPLGRKRSRIAQLRGSED